MTRWKSMRYHLSQYHGHRQMWMFGLDQDQLVAAHRACYPWCHKPERDIRKAFMHRSFLTPEEIRKILSVPRQ